MRWRLTLLPPIAVAALFGIAPAQQPTSGPPQFFQLLRNRVGVSDRELSVALPAGQALAFLLPIHGKGEIAAAGVERIGVPLEFFLDSFREMPVIERGRQTLLVREFSNPPREQDLQPLVLRQEDIQALPGCTPGDCSVKLSAAMIEQFRSQAAGNSSTEHLFRDLILQYLTQYLEKGNSGMITYADKVPVVQSSDAFRALLKEFDWLSDAAPPLYDCLESFSGNACPQIESFFYWSSVRFGLKPVFSITHLMLYRTVQGGLPWVYIAFKQIYADHYFDVSLGLAVLVEQSAGPADPALWVLYINRSHTDALKGWLGTLKRTIAQRRSRAAMQKHLLELKANLEGKYSRLAKPSRAAVSGQLGVVRMSNQAQ